MSKAEDKKLITEAMRLLGSRKSARKRAACARNAAKGRKAYLAKIKKSKARRE